MEKSKNRVGIIIIANMLAVIILLLIILLVNQNKILNKENNKQDVDKQDVNKPEVVTKNIDVNDILIRGLNKYILRTNITEEKNVYQNKKVTVKDLSDETIFTTLFRGDNIDLEKDSYKNKIESYPVEVKYYYFTKEFIDSKVEEIFGEGVKVILNNKIMFPGTSLEFNNNEYVYTIFPGGGALLWSGTSTLLKAEEKEDELYIYDRYIHSVEDEGNIKYYNASDRVKLVSENIEDVFKIEKVVTGDAIRYIDTVIAGDIFKHTFKKNSNGSYYWYSTEIVK